MGRLGSECWRSVLTGDTWRQGTAVGTCSKGPQVTELLERLSTLTWVWVCVLSIFGLDFLDEQLKIEAHDSEVLCLAFSPTSTGESPPAPPPVLVVPPATGLSRRSLWLVQV